MSKRTRKPPANPLAYFKHAQHFFASDLCLMHPSQPQEVKDFTIWGAVVMSALASELLLKCLAALEAGHVRHTHDLKALFDNLSPKTRAQIEREWDDISALKKHIIDDVERQAKMQIPRKLEDALDVGANCFECLRYPDLVPDAFFFLSDLPQALIEVIISLKPEWTAELTFRVPKPNAESTGTGAILRAPERRRGWRQLWSKLSRDRS